MKTMWNALFLGLAMWSSVQASAADANNRKLGDVMNLLSDQVNGLVELQKKAPADVDAKGFDRALSRARAGQWLIEISKEKMGVLKDGVFTAAELTPGKVANATGEEQAKLLAQYAEFLSGAQLAFGGVEKAIQDQVAAKPEERNFAGIKAANAKIFTAMSAAHKIFKP